MPVGKIFDIQRFCTHDGPGIRTTVFLKGCPLRCRWCHNPEGLEAIPRLRYNAELCIGCRLCAQNCPNGAHGFDETKHTVDYSLCRTCGTCAAVCPSGALTVCGVEMDPDETAEAVLKDRLYYGKKGGVTFSGGEPLLQDSFVAACIRKLKKEGVGCCVDTSLCVERNALDAVMPYTDLFLCDIKAVTDTLHQAATGVSNARILENFRYLSEKSFPIWIRIPLIAEYNGTREEIEKIAAFVRKLSGVGRITLIPYHKFGNGKYDALGYPPPAVFHAPAAEEIAAFRQIFREYDLPIDSE